MKNRIAEFYRENGWKQQQFADAINDALEAMPHLKKKTKKNPEGIVDQQTAGRLLNGETDLSQRWIDILSYVFGCSPQDLFYPKKEDPLALLSRYEQEMGENLSPLARDILEALKNMTSNP